TSGSTGKPKGVMVEHASVVDHVQAYIALCALTARDRVLQFGSFSFDASVEEIFPALAVGAALIIRPDHVVMPDAEFIELMRRHDVTSVHLPTAFWHAWSAEVGQGRHRPPASLQLVIAGGEAAGQQQFATWTHAMQDHPARWLNTYGPTEATVTATAWGWRNGMPLPSGNPPIGRPLPGTPVYVLDQFGALVPPGAIGELCIGGTRVARGYLNRDELSAERFVPDPYSAAPG
ncbi:AMP-binding protein, partial [Rugamonas sp. A1-17]|nr:AMP-binding protein [Rugamonas sp. A1-17]